MTSKDRRDIKNLYYFHRFTLAAVARLYRVSHTRIQQILQEKTIDLIPTKDNECLICGLEEVIMPFYIDGNESNRNPQNVLMLCEADIRKFSHLKKRSKPQF
jgi:hypothetical protein